MEQSLLPIRAPDLRSNGMGKPRITTEVRTFVVAAGITLLLGSGLTFWWFELQQSSFHESGRDKVDRYLRGVGVQRTQAEEPRGKRRPVSEAKRERASTHRSAVSGVEATRDLGTTKGRMTPPEGRVRLGSLPWSVAGQCVSGAALGDRMAYFSEFAEAEPAAESASSTPPAARTLKVAPGVSKAAIFDVRSALGDAHTTARAYVKELLPPDVYIHRTTDELRRHACVADSALSYYDGAIHVAVSENFDELKKSIRHEYGHHILAMLGVGRPVWLQEGFAQRFSGETSGSVPLTKNSLGLRNMVEPLSITSSHEEVAAFYAQASDMLEFLNALPRVQEKRRGYPGLLDELGAALDAGTTVPEDLFVWATEERGENVVDGDPVAFWEEYLSQGGFDDVTQARIEEERRARGDPGLSLYSPVILRR